MGFSPDIVGLTGERITGKFGESRSNGCPHKGLDISSSRQPMDFKAGVFGEVISPIGGQWGTITIRPFQAPKTRIQYLHCSTINVEVGSVVAPWTVIGKTGDTAPADSGVHGIHLHLQVEAPGEAAEECWKGRNFLDPEKWEIQDMMAGTWRLEEKYTRNPMQDEQHFSVRIPSSDIGSITPARRHVISIVEGCKHEIKFWWPGNSIIAHTENYALIDSPEGSCESSSNCGTPAPCKAVASQFAAHLMQKDLLLYGGYFCTRAESHSDPDESNPGPGTHADHAGPYIIAAKCSSDFIDTESILAHQNSRDIESFYGVLPGEIF